MSFQRTYVHTVLIGIDDLGAAVFLNRNDVTISTAAGLVLRMDKGEKAARDVVLVDFAFHDWQITALRRIGKALEWLKPGHCERARLADIQRGRGMAVVLTSVG